MNNGSLLDEKPKSLEDLERALPPDHPDLAKAYNCTGRFYSYYDDYQLALEYHLKAVKIYELVLPQEHPILTDVYYNIAHLYHYLGNKVLSTGYWVRVRLYCKQVLPEYDPIFAGSYNNEGHIFDSKDDYHEAFQMRLFYISAGRFIDHEEQPCSRLAMVYESYGYIYASLGRHHLALEYYFKAIDTRERLQRPEYRFLAWSFSRVAAIYESIGYHLWALEYEQKAAEMRERAEEAFYSQH